MMNCAFCAAMCLLLMQHVAAEPLEADESLLNGFFRYRAYASHTGPGSDAAASHWTWHGIYQDSKTLLELAARPSSGTTPAAQRGRRHVNHRLSLIEAFTSLEQKSVFEIGNECVGAT